MGGRDRSPKNERDLVDIIPNTWFPFILFASVKISYTIMSTRTPVSLCLALKDSSLAYGILNSKVLTLFIFIFYE